MKEIKKNISQIRKDYKLKQLDISDVTQDPLLQLEKWLEEAISSEVLEPTAMVLSTVSSAGRPSSRVLLLKGISEEGLVFYTNYESRKGSEISLNSFASINIFWAELERQVRVEGKIQKVSAKDSDEYFSSRPRGSQIGALASPQSETIANRDYLENKVTSLEKEFENKEIPRPANWGGYILEPDYFEFWQGRPSRLHDRIVYEKTGSNWDIKRIAP